MLKIQHLVKTNTVTKAGNQNTKLKKENTFQNNLVNIKWK